MTDCGSNSLVSFLKTYGPSASADMLSDEHVRSALAHFNVSPIEVPAPRLDSMVEALCGEAATNLILTGTAGDGKTFHIRKFLLEKLGMAPEAWPGAAPVLEWALPSGIPLRIIRDLSELEEEDKQRELASIASCLRGEDKSVRYLIAANDGQLLRYFRSDPVLGLDDIHRALARMLRFEKERETLDLTLLNLSRSWSGETVDAIIDQIVDHPEWDAACVGCPGTAEPSPCPIRLNRSLLQGRNPADAVFRSRIKDVLRLGAANDSHIPIRYLIMLVVNILLGDKTTPDDPLLDCEKARLRALKKSYGACNPYENALGLNVPEGRRSTNVVFGLMSSLGLGEETNNFLDDLLTTRTPRPMAEQLFANDQIYGHRMFEPAHHAYYVSADRRQADAFRRAIATQRRRAFFRLPARDDAGSPWRLTVFHHAGLYLKVIEALETGADKALLDSVTRKLIKGLNRAYSGMMAEETERLWLAGTIGRTDDPVGRIATVESIGRSARMESIKLALGNGVRRPSLLVSTRAVEQELEPLDLRPLLFEYLLRVEEGSLPSSFSRQCQQEIRQFALIVAAALGDVGEEGDLTSVRVLSLAHNGGIQAKTLEV